MDDFVEEGDFEKVRYGGVEEFKKKKDRPGCNGYSGTHLVPECEGYCPDLIPGLERLDIKVTNRKDFKETGTRIIRGKISFEEIMKTVGCYGCEEWW